MASAKRIEGLPWIEGDGSLWSVIPDWEHKHGFQYDMFSVDVPSIVHSILHECFIKEPIFIEAIDTLLGITGTSMEREHSRAKHHAEGYFIEDGKLWCLGGATPTCTCLSSGMCYQTGGYTARQGGTCKSAHGP